MTFQMQLTESAGSEILKRITKIIRTIDKYPMMESQKVKICKLFIYIELHKSRQIIMTLFEN